MKANTAYRLTKEDQIQKIRDSISQSLSTSMCEFQGILLYEVAEIFTNEGYDIARYHFADPRKNYSLIYWEEEKDSNGHLFDYDVVTPEDLEYYSDDDNDDCDCDYCFSCDCDDCNDYDFCNSFCNNCDNCDISETENTKSTEDLED